MCFSRTSTPVLPPLPPPPPDPLLLLLTWQRVESRGEKSWRQARIISYICPHFLQKMMDLANYPMLPSPSRPTSGRHRGGSRCALGAKRSPMLCASSFVKRRGEASQILSCVREWLFWQKKYFLNDSHFSIFSPPSSSSSSPLRREMSLEETRWAPAERRQSPVEAEGRSGELSRPRTLSGSAARALVLVAACQRHPVATLNIICSFNKHIYTQQQQQRCETKALSSCLLTSCLMKRERYTRHLLCVIYMPFRQFRKYVESMFINVTRIHS